MRDIDVQENDKFFIKHLEQGNKQNTAFRTKPISEPSNPLSVINSESTEDSINKIIQTEEEMTPFDCIKLFVYYKEKEFEVFARLDDKIINFTEKVLREERRNKGYPQYVKWNFEGKVFWGNHSSTIAGIGLYHEAVIRGKFLGDEPYAGEVERPTGRFSTRSLGVQTVAKPDVQYPLLPHLPPPPPMVNDPPPAKT